VNLRIRALERRKLPEELDQLSGLARPWAWLGIAALALAVIALVAWSFFGKIPRTVSGAGVIATPGSLATVQSTVPGTVTQVLVSQNSYVSSGQTLATITAGKKTTLVTAPFAGQVEDVAVLPGQVVSFGTQLFVLQKVATLPSASKAYLFIPTTDAGNLAPGMTVNITVATAPSAVYGVLHGKVASVSVAPLSTAAVSALVANPDLATQLTKKGPPLLAEVRLMRCKTKSGYCWSTPKGPPFPIASGTPVSAQVVQTQQRPIDVVFGS
jgi:multidrug efflux pump subunit AcrA (membrane-fusion protein)